MCIWLRCHHVLLVSFTTQWCFASTMLESLPKFGPWPAGMFSQYGILAMSKKFITKFEKPDVSNGAFRWSNISRNLLYNFSCKLMLNLFPRVKLHCVSGLEMFSQLEPSHSHATKSCPTSYPINFAASCEVSCDAWTLLNATSVTRVALTVLDWFLGENWFTSVCWYGNVATFANMLKRKFAITLSVCNLRFIIIMLPQKIPGEKNKLHCKAFSIMEAVEHAKHYLLVKLFGICQSSN